MESQHMTQQVFAESIGQSPATLSSIFNGRTRPTINIVDAIKKKIPNINTDWLLFGSGSMYLDQKPLDETTPTYPSSGGNAPGFDPNPMLDFDQAPSTMPQNVVQQSSKMNSVNVTRFEMAQKEIKLVDKPQRKITEIRIFYDDQTFDVFEPKKK
jgi:DNA-binding XRE family transcriptional regulator